MSSQARILRRAAERQLVKAARKAGFALPQPAAAPVADTGTPTETTLTETTTTQAETTETSGVSPDPAISPARLSANRTNALRSTGPKTPSTRAISAQNHTLHGLARHHNGTFKLIATEDPAAFEALQQSLLDEHLPATETESILVLSMAESHWLAKRAGHLLESTSLDPNSGVITDEKTFSLYTRYQTTHTRAFHKCLNDLLKLRAERRKAEFGFEAERMQNETHELKKQGQEADLLRKNAQTCRELSLLAHQNCSGRRQIRGFAEEYEAQLAQRGLQNIGSEAASQVA